MTLNLFKGNLSVTGSKIQKLGSTTRDSHLNHAVIPVHVQKQMNVRAPRKVSLAKRHVCVPLIVAKDIMAATVVHAVDSAGRTTTVIAVVSIVNAIQIYAKAAVHMEFWTLLIATATMSFTEDAPTCTYSVTSHAGRS